MHRRSFLGVLLAATGLTALRPWRYAFGRGGSREEAVMRLFLCGDVMTGRGIDQVLSHSVDPVLYEGFVKDARQYVSLAEAENGEIPSPVAPDYAWGDARRVLDGFRPDARIINLETAVTTSGDAWPGKNIHYRMHPKNVNVLNAAGIDVCVLANNHVLDWGEAGFAATLDTIEAAGMATAGAGRDRSAARAPVRVSLGHDRRLLVYAAGMESAGVPSAWAASEDDAGVAFLPDLSEATLTRLAEDIREAREPGDVVVFSVHWGGNWGYDVPDEQRRFARGLIDEAGVDVVYGHSSHHPKPFEFHHGRLILYGCGDFLNDYEGIGGHDDYRPELTLMYLPELEPSGRIRQLDLVPMRIERFRLHRADPQDAEWLAQRLEERGRGITPSLVARNNGKCLTAEPAD